MTEADTLSWTHVRAASYAGPTNTLIHTHLPVSESTVLGVAEDRKKEIGKPNNWQCKIVDTDLTPSVNDPEGNGGRTIAIAIWSAHNIELDREVKRAQGRRTEKEGETNASESEKSSPFLPPELRLDVLNDLLSPIHGAQPEIMGTQPYLMLNSLATHPDHHRRGCGSILLKWGIEKADALGLPMYLSTSVAGKPLYERHGFELVREFVWDRRPWGGEGLDWHGAMVRKAKGKDEGN
jgi:GNAT superfamily N-acetyltransferase